MVVFPGNPSRCLFLLLLTGIVALFPLLAFFALKQPPRAWVALLCSIPARRKRNHCSCYQKLRLRAAASFRRQRQTRNGDAKLCSGCADGGDDRAERLHFRVWRSFARYASSHSQAAMVDGRSHQPQGDKILCCLEAAGRGARVPRQAACLWRRTDG